MVVPCYVIYSLFWPYKSIPNPTQHQKGCSILWTCYRWVVKILQEVFEIKTTRNKVTEINTMLGFPVVKLKMILLNEHEDGYHIGSLVLLMQMIKIEILDRIRVPSLYLFDWKVVNSKK